jgi:signal transduction histidine kinase
MFVDADWCGPILRRCVDRELNRAIDRTTFCAMTWTTRHFPFFSRHADLVKGCAVAVLAIGLASAVALVLKASVDYVSTAIFLAAVMISAWYGGLVPGLLATALASLFSLLLMFDPAFSLSMGLYELTRLGMFGMAAVLISSLTGRIRRSEQALRDLNADLEQRVVARTAALEKSNKRLQSFCYTLAHDLRAPLRSMDGFAGLLLDKYGTHIDSSGRDYARRISAAARRMDRLINDLLTYTEITQKEVHLTEVDIDRCVRSVLESLDWAIAESGAEISIDYPLGTVSGKSDMVELVVSNLLTNSLKFTRRGVKPVIRLWSQRRNSHIRLWVEDNGIGIDPDHQHHLFGVFHTMQSGPDQAGTGIGLALVRAAVENMHGNVGVESQLGRGSRFWIELTAATGPGKADR